MELVRFLLWLVKSTLTVTVNRPVGLTLSPGGIDMKRVTVVILALVLCAFATTIASAQANIGLKGVGFGIGVVDPENIDMTMGLAVYGFLGTVHPNFGIDTYVGYWKYSEEVVGVEASFRDISVGVRGKYLIHATPTVTPFIGAGVGAHFVTAEGTIPAFDFGGITTPEMSFSDTETKAGFDVGGGVQFDVNERIAIQADAWYTIVSDFNQLAARGGLMFKL